MAIDFFEFTATHSRAVAARLIDVQPIDPTDRVIESVTLAANALREELQTAAYIFDPSVRRARTAQLHERLGVCQDVLRDVEAR